MNAIIPAILILLVLAAFWEGGARPMVIVRRRTIIVDRNERGEIIRVTELGGLELQEWRDAP